MGERERERRRRRRREEEALAERKRIHIMSLAKHTWVWNKKFTVKTTTKLLLATSPCKSKSISSNNEILERQEADRLFENRSGLLRRRRRSGGKLAVFARASAAAGRNSVNVSSSIEDPAVEKKKEGEGERREEEERRNVVGNIQTVAKKYSSSSSSSSSVSEELPLSKSAIPVETVKALKADLFGQQVGNPIVDDVGKLSSQADVLRRLVEMSKTVERDGLSLKKDEKDEKEEERVLVVVVEKSSRGSFSSGATVTAASPKGCAPCFAGGFPDSRRRSLCLSTSLSSRISESLPLWVVLTTGTGSSLSSSR